MKSKSFKHEGIIQIDPKSFKDLAENETRLREQLKDRDSGKRLKVDFILSHSGKLINGRIYSVKGQENVAKSLIDKPVNLDHSWTVESIIGRVSKASLVPTLDYSPETLKKYKIEKGDLASLYDALKKLDYKKISEILNDSDLLYRKGWNGVAELRASVEISDQISIDKFLDRRYLNFSAEQSALTKHCSICQKDMYARYADNEEEPCRHYEGNAYKGKICFAICGDMEGMGAAVVMHGGDPEAIVKAMELSDSQEEEKEAPIFYRGKFMVEDNNPKDKEIFAIGATESKEVNIENIVDSIKELGEAAEQNPSKSQDKNADAGNETSATDLASKEQEIVLTNDEFKKTIDSLKAEIATALQDRDSAISSRDKAIAEKEEAIAAKEQLVKDSTETILSFKDKYGKILSFGKALQDQEKKILDWMTNFIRNFDSSFEAPSNLDKINEKLRTLNPSMDRVKNFLDSGLNRPDSNIVESPLVEDTDLLKEKETKDTYLLKIEKTYKDKKEISEKEALRYLNNLKRSGYVPKNFNP